MSYPEHEKLRAVQSESQSIGEFIEWLKWNKKIVFAKWDEKTDLDILRVVSLPTNDILAEYFEIDLNKLEQEKQAMLEEFRRLAAKKD